MRRKTSIETIAVFQLSDKSLNNGIGSGNLGKGMDVSAIKVVELTILSGGYVSRPSF